MRYRDARHIDLRNFHARRPAVGALVRYAAYAVIAVVPVLVQQQAWRTMTGLLVGVVLWWLLAWKLGVGTTWRTAPVAAALLLASCLTLHRLGVLT